jgi:hypothetical protein
VSAHSTADDHKKEAEFGRLFLYLSPVYYSPLQMGVGILQKKVLERIAGPFEKVSMDQTAAIPPATPALSLALPAPATIRVAAA